MNNLITWFIEAQCSFFKLLGWKTSSLTVGYSIKQRVLGRLGLDSDVDRFAEMYGLKRRKNKYLYESNNDLTERICVMLNPFSNKIGEK